MIDLPPQQLSMVRAVLNAVVPGVPAYAFGSRVTGRAKKHSDLDLALQPVQPLDWAACSDAFKARASPLHQLG